MIGFCRWHVKVSEKLAFYALSMFWRAAVYAWKTINQQTTSIRLRPKDEEAIRKYLLVW